VGEILARYEKKGYKLLAMKLMRVTEELAHQHYAEHVGKPFFPGLVEYITSGPVVALVLGGKGVVAGVRAMNGATNPANAAPGTIRGDYGIEVGRNVVHASDSVESAEREIAIYFKEEEILSYEKNVDAWLYE
ncbi:MAG: nucleoside-diphosphate kinase, partial [Bacillota bacterium]